MISAPARATWPAFFFPCRSAAQPPRHAGDDNAALKTGFQVPPLSGLGHFSSNSHNSLNINTYRFGSRQQQTGQAILCNSLGSFQTPMKPLGTI
jgi:hypothetical protein